MEYTPTTWKDGDVITAAKMNKLEQGVQSAASLGGVTSFNGRTGAVVPQSGDYTAAQVGARASTWMPTAQEVGARPDTWAQTAEDVGAIPTGDVSFIVSMTETEYNALAIKSDTTLYLIKE